jgi:outer membrane protein assembly factor BamB
MKQSKILFLIVIALGALLLVSCIPGAAQPRGWSGTTVHDGIIYVGTRDGRVVAINASTQNKLWDHAITPATTIYTTPLVYGDLVYIGTYGGQVLALSTLARSQNLTFPQRRYGEWERVFPIENARSNAIVADLVISEDALYVASSNGRVYSLDKRTGDENWRREDIPVLADKLWTSPVIQGDTLYVSTLDGHIYALSAETGKLRDWFFQLPAGFVSPPVIYGDTIFLGSFDRFLYAIEIYAIEIGGDEPVWRFPREKPAGNWFWASPLVHEGIVYAGSLDGKLYAIDVKTGDRLWEFDAGDPIVSSPVLMGNLLIVVNESGTVYVFDLAADNRNKGVPLRAISIDADVKSPFYAEEGLVYIRGEDNKLYVVDIDKGEVVGIPLWLVENKDRD